MKRYRISIRGNNLLLNIDGEHHRCGFTTTRYVRAADETLARKTALIEVRQNPALKERLFDAGRIIPQICVEAISEIGRFAFWQKRHANSFDFFIEEETNLSAVQPTEISP